MSSVSGIDGKAGPAGKTGLACLLSRFGRRFGRDVAGSVAIEFSMLAIPFSLLVFAILETCISFAGQQVLANAADDIARQMRTGQIKTIDEAELREMVCDKMEIMVTQGCPGLIVDLRHDANSFAALAALSFRISHGNVIPTKNGADEQGFEVDLGEAGTKNMLRIFYKWPIVTDFMGKLLSGSDDGTTLHFATMTWQNEPY